MAGWSLGSPEMERCSALPETEKKSSALRVCFGRPGGKGTVLDQGTRERQLLTFSAEHALLL